MRNGTASIVAILMLALAAPAGGQEREPTPREDYEAFRGEPKRAPEIPRALRSIITESRPERLVVRGLAGQAIPVSLEWFEPFEFTLLHNGRYLAFRYVGYEEDGYILVDRAANGEPAIHETGVAPVFSPNGRYFAAAQTSEAGWNNLEGVGLWEILPDRTVRRFFTNVLPNPLDLRVDRWIRPDCVLVSSVESGYQVPETQDYDRAVREAPRSLYFLEAADGVTMTGTDEDLACAPGQTP